MRGESADHTQSRARACESDQRCRAGLMRIPGWWWWGCSQGSGRRSRDEFALHGAPGMISRRIEIIGSEILRQTRTGQPAQPAGHSTERFSRGKKVKVKEGKVGSPGPRWSVRREQETHFVLTQPSTWVASWSLPGRHIASALRPPALACYLITCSTDGRAARTRTHTEETRGGCSLLPPAGGGQVTGLNPLPWSSPAETNQRKREGEEGSCSVEPKCPPPPLLGGEEGSLPRPLGPGSRGRGGRRDGLDGGGDAGSDFLLALLMAGSVRFSSFALLDPPLQPASALFWYVCACVRACVCSRVSITRHIHLGLSSGSTSPPSSALGAS